MEKNNKKKSNTVPPPMREAPKVQIREDVRKAIDNIVPQLTQHETQYLVAKVKQDFIRRAKMQAPPAVLQTTQNKAEIPLIDPVLQPILDDISKAEAYLTKGYTVEYPPKALVPVGQQTKEPDLLGLVQYAVDRLSENPKVADGLGNLLNALAKKLEGEK